MNPAYKIISIIIAVSAFFYSDYSLAQTTVRIPQTQSVINIGSNPSGTVYFDLSSFPKIMASDLAATTLVHFTVEDGGKIYTSNGCGQKSFNIGSGVSCETKSDDGNRPHRHKMNIVNSGYDQITKRIFVQYSWETSRNLGGTWWITLQSGDARVIEPPPPPTLTFTADSANLPYNGKTILRWTATNVENCNLSGLERRSLNLGAISGTREVGPLTESKIIAVECDNGGWPPAAVAIFKSIGITVKTLESISKSATINVAAPIPPSITFFARPTSILLGQTSTLWWSVSGNADSCTASGAWSGAKSTLDGSQGVSPGAGTNTYTLRCVGPTGLEDAKNAIITVSNPLPSADIKANSSDGPISIGFAQSATISWTSIYSQFPQYGGSCSVSKIGNSSEKTISPNNVYILEDDGSAESEALGGGLSPADISAIFYKKYPDIYDFIAIFPSFPTKEESDAIANTWNVQNDVRGICMKLVRARDDVLWSLAGSDKLKSVELFTYRKNNYDELVKNPEEIVNILLHELAHTWGVELGNVEIEGELPDGINKSCLNSKIPLAKKKTKHWSGGLQMKEDAIDFMEEALPWRDAGGGIYTLDLDFYDKPQKFHPFDLYLMGLMDKSEIKEEFLLLITTDTESYLTDIEGYTEGDALPDGRILKKSEVAVKTTSVKVTINDVIEIAGEERSPNVRQSQKDFKQAFVILVKPGQAPPDNMLKTINKAAETLPGKWAEATLNRSSMNKVFADDNAFGSGTSGSQSTGNLTSGGARTYSISCSGPLGSVSDSVVVDVAEPHLSVALSASPLPPAGTTSSYTTTLIANIGGTAIGTINYSLWWNCNNSTASVSTASSACGALPTATSGNCAENANGVKCEAVNSVSLARPHTFSCPAGGPTCNFKPKVITERTNLSATDDLSAGFGCSGACAGVGVGPSGSGTGGGGGAGAGGGGAGTGSSGIVAGTGSLITILPPPPYFTLSKSGNLEAGVLVNPIANSNKIQITANPFNLYSAAVTLEILSGPAGTQAHFGTSGASTANLTAPYPKSIDFWLTIPRATAVGSHTIKIRGIGGGVSDTIEIPLNVIQRQPEFREI